MNNAQRFITYREINEIPRCIDEVVNKMKDISNIASSISSVKRMYFIGCGSSYYASMGASLPLILDSSGYMDVKALPASEYIFYYAKKSDENSAVIAISRSGKTTEIIRALEYANKQNATTIGITCSRSSPMESAAKYTIVLDNCHEESYVMTKSFVEMMLAGMMLSAEICKYRRMDTSTCEEVSRNIDSLSRAASEALNRDDLYEDIAAKIIDREAFIFLGTTITMPIALEASLKFKEMSYSFTEALHILEFRHGPIALSQRKNDLAIFSIVPDDDSVTYAERLIDELSSKGFSEYTVTNSKELASKPNTIYINWTGSAYLLLPAAIIPLYLISYHRTILKGFNPDRPMHLEKVVERM